MIYFSAVIYFVRVYTCFRGIFFYFVLLIGHGIFDRVGYHFFVFQSHISGEVYRGVHATSFESVVCNLPQPYRCRRARGHGGMKAWQ